MAYYSVRDTYRYHFKVGNVIVHGGITTDLFRREREHQNSGHYTPYYGAKLYWKNGHIMQVGPAVTRETALQWELDNGFGQDQHL